MISYKIIRSDRRTLALEICRDGAIVVRAPRKLPADKIQVFVESHAEWIARSTEKMRKKIRFNEQHFSTPEQIAALKRKAEEILPQKTEAWAAVMGVRPSGVRITNAQTRFGSCSSKNSISFSCRLMAYPENAIDYVIVHELAHIRHKNHSPAFYAYIARFLPDYRQCEAILKSN